MNFQKKKNSLKCLLLFFFAFCLIANSSCSVKWTSSRENFHDDLSHSQKLIPKDTLVGISFPEHVTQKWNTEGMYLSRYLKDAGFKTELEYANNKISLQITQIEKMIHNGSKIIVIAPVNAYALNNVLQSAKTSGIVIVSFDRLILGTQDVDYYVSFNYHEAGKMQANYIVKQLGLHPSMGCANANKCTPLEKDEKGVVRPTKPFNIELIAGSEGDNNAKLLFDGAYEVLKPYFNSGILQVSSGEQIDLNGDFSNIAIKNWKKELALVRVEDTINTYYNKKEHRKLDAILAPNDSIALACIIAVENTKLGYFPVITGMDADPANIYEISKKKQGMTVYKDAKKICKITTEMIKQISQGDDKVFVNDVSSINNKNKIVPSRILTPFMITRSNIRKELVDKGYISLQNSGLTND